MAQSLEEWSAEAAVLTERDQRVNGVEPVGYSVLQGELKQAQCQVDKV